MLLPLLVQRKFFIFTSLDLQEAEGPWAPLRSWQMHPTNADDKRGRHRGFRLFDLLSAKGRSRASCLLDFSGPAGE